MLLVLGAAAAVGASMLLPVVLRAQDDQPGTGAPHQERNPSQHPELFSGSAQGSQPAQTPEVVTVRRSTRRHRAKVEGPAIFVVTTPTRAEGIETPDDIIGTGAPHQERNPSAHPELFVPRAQR